MNWQKVKKDLFLALSSQIFDKVIGYVLLIILVRYLEKDSMGEFFFAAALASFAILLTELGGTKDYLIREVARNPDKAIQHFSEFISFRLPLFALYFLFLNCFVLIFNPNLTTTIFLTSIYVFFQHLFRSFSALFLGLKRVMYSVIAGVSARLLLVVGLLCVVVILGGSLNMILTTHIIAYAVLVGLAAYLMWHNLGRLQLVWRPEAFRRIFQVSLPFFGVVVLELTHFKVDTLMLGFMKPYTVLATYEAAFRLLEASQFLIRPVVMIFFPLYSEMATHQNWQEMQNLYKKMLLVTGSVGGSISLVVVTTASFIIPIMFGSKYYDSIPVLKVLYLSVPMIYLKMVSLFSANSIHLEKRIVKIMTISVIVNIMLNGITIPLWGALGAAWTTVISETILAAWLVRLNFGQLRISRTRGAVAVTDRYLIMPTDR